MNEIVSFVGASPRLQAATLEVLGRLSEIERENIGRKRVLISSANLRPAGCFGTTRANPWAGSDFGGSQAAIEIDDARLPTPEALSAVIAHELAHVRLNHHLDLVRWLNDATLTVDRLQRRRERAEAEVDGLLGRWGMSSYVAALNELRLARLLAIGEKAI